MTVAAAYGKCLKYYVASNRLVMPSFRYYDESHAQAHHPGSRRRSPLAGRAIRMRRWGNFELYVVSDMRSTRMEAV